MYIRCRCTHCVMSYTMCGCMCCDAHCVCVHDSREEKELGAFQAWKPIMCVYRKNKGRSKDQWRISIHILFQFYYTYDLWFWFMMVTCDLWFWVMMIICDSRFWFMMVVFWANMMWYVGLLGSNLGSYLISQTNPYTTDPFGNSPQSTNWGLTRSSMGGAGTRLQHSWYVWGFDSVQLLVLARKLLYALQ